MQYVASVFNKLTVWQMSYDQMSSVYNIHNTQYSCLLPYGVKFYDYQDNQTHSHVMVWIHQLFGMITVVQAWFEVV